MFSYSVVLSIALSIEHAELLEEGGVEGTFSETILALREDQMRKTATCSRTGLQPYEHGTLSLSLSLALCSPDAILRYLNKWNMNAKHSRVAQSGI